MAAKKKTFTSDESPVLQFLTDPEPEPTPAPEEPTQTKTTAPGKWSRDPGAEKRTKRVQLVLAPSLYNAAKAEADRQGASFNELCIRALEAQITKGAE